MLFRMLYNTRDDAISQQRNVEQSSTAPVEWVDMYIVVDVVISHCHCGGSSLLPFFLSFLLLFRFWLRIGSSLLFFQVFPPHHSVAWFGKATGKATACHMTELCIAYINRPRSLSRSIRLPNYKITG